MIRHVMLGLVVAMVVGVSAFGLHAQQDEPKPPEIEPKPAEPADAEAARKAYDQALDKARQDYAARLLEVKQAYLETLNAALKEATLEGGVEEAKELKDKVEQVERTVANLKNLARELTGREKHLGYRLQVHPPKARRHNGHYYMVIERALSWPEARDHCRRLGGYLATVTDKQENEFLLRLTGGKPVWLGATDAQEEGVWRWITGEVSDFTDWKRGQPDNGQGDEDYLQLQGRGRQGGSWSDAGPRAKAQFVCEWEM